MCVDEGSLDVKYRDASCLDEKCLDESCPDEKTFEVEGRTMEEAKEAEMESLPDMMDRYRGDPFIEAVASLRVATSTVGATFDFRSSLKLITLL